MTNLIKFSYLLRNWSNFFSFRFPPNNACLNNVHSQQVIIFKKAHYCSDHSIWLRRRRSKVRLLTEHVSSVRGRGIEYQACLRIKHRGSGVRLTTCPGRKLHSTSMVQGLVNGNDTIRTYSLQIGMPLSFKFIIIIVILTSM